MRLPLISSLICSLEATLLIISLEKCREIVHRKSYVTLTSDLWENPYTVQKDSNDPPSKVFSELGQQRGIFYENLRPNQKLNVIGYKVLL